MFNEMQKRTHEHINIQISKNVTPLHKNVTYKNITSSFLGWLSIISQALGEDQEEEQEHVKNQHHLITHRLQKEIRWLLKN